MPDRATRRLIDEGAATEFAASVAAGYSIYSTLNSSPWTARSFGGDEAKARSCLFYAKLAMWTNIGLGLFVSLIARSLWPLAGFLVVTVEMQYLYHQAVDHARASGSMSWHDPGSATAVRGGRRR